MLVTVTEAKARLGELIREAAEEDAVVVQHGHPGAVLVGGERYDALLDEVEDLKDHLAVYESTRSEPTLHIGLEKMAAELGVLGHPVRLLLTVFRAVGAGLRLETWSRVLSHGLAASQGELSSRRTSRRCHRRSSAIRSSPPSLCGLRMA